MRKAEARASHCRWADFVSLPEDDRRELIDGRLEEHERPTKWHEYICMVLGPALTEWAFKQGGFVVLGSAYRVRVSDRRGVMPDVQMLTADAYERAGAQGLETGRPELVVEVVSPMSRAHDRLRKLDWYAALGVPEYWLVDPETRSIVCHRLSGSTYSIAEHAQGEVTFRPTSLKGFKLPLARLWVGLPKA